LIVPKKGKKKGYQSMQTITENIHVPFSDKWNYSLYVVYVPEIYSVLNFGGKKTASVESIKEPVLGCLF